MYIEHLAIPKIPKQINGNLSLVRQIEKISPLFKMASIDNKIIPDKIRRTVTSHSAEMILSTNKCWDNTPEAPPKYSTCNYK